MTIELVDQTVDGAGRNDRVVVEQQNRVAAALADPDIVRAREAGVRSDFDDAYVSPCPGDCRAAIGRSVVDDDDAVWYRRRRGVQRRQAALEIGRGVERDDDDRDALHAFSITRNVSAAARGQLYFASCAG